MVTAVAFIAVLQHHFNGISAGERCPKSCISNFSWFSSDVPLCSFHILVCCSHLFSGLSWIYLHLSISGHWYLSDISFFIFEGLVGLVLSYSLSITSLLINLVTSFTETEKNMISMERAQQYVDGVPSESDDPIASVRNNVFSLTSSPPHSLRLCGWYTMSPFSIGLQERSGRGSHVWSMWVITKQSLERSLI